MKRFSNFVFFSIFLVFLTFSISSANTTFFLEKPVNWNTTPGQIQLDLLVNTNQPFNEVEGIIRASFTSGVDNINLIPFRFPMLNNKEKEDTTKWSFVEKKESGKFHFYIRTADLADSSMSFPAQQGSYLVAELFFKVDQIPTSGKFVVWGQNIVVNDENINDFALEINLGPQVPLRLFLSSPAKTLEVREQSFDINLDIENKSQDTIMTFQCYFWLNKGVKIDTVFLPPSWLYILDSTRVNYDNTEIRWSLIALPKDNYHNLTDTIINFLNIKARLKPNELAREDFVRIFMDNVVINNNHEEKLDLVIPDELIIPLKKDNRIKGDVDLDGDVDLNDLSLACLQALGVIELNPDAFWGADMDDNNDIDYNTDLLGILAKTKYDDYILAKVSNITNQMILDKMKMLLIKGDNIETILTEGTFNYSTEEINRSFFFVIMEDDSEYSGRLTFNNGAQLDSGYILVKTTTDNVKETFDNGVGIRAYPNPVLNYLHLDNLDNSQIIKNIEIFNYLGEKVKGINNNNLNNNIQIDLSQLNSGLYYLKINHKIIKKIIKQ